MRDVGYAWCICQYRPFFVIEWPACLLLKVMAISEDVTWQEGEGACGEGGEVLMREERRYGAGDLEALGTGPEAKAPI